LSAFPAIYNRLVDGGLLGLPRDRAWRIMTFGGHAPELVCLHDAAAGVLIAADQVLPHISPMIGMVPQEPDDEPLGEYLGSLKRLIQLPASTIVLPSHGRPFRGLHDRLNDLMAHHQERLDTLLGCIDGEHTAALLSARLFPKVDSAVHRAFALSETLAHLRYLEKAGNVRRSADAGVEYFRLAGSA
jgi:glyoxylase-like metal-dependent hydrolase (beta-lactamase superfamily II)